MNGAANKAVFLSYASQDAEGARRICDALRAAGVEVWFDQSELRGGDAWDAKIRKQIKECALFVPIVSANTQARREGYFRLEWRLADQRTHLMGRSGAFIVPVCVDDTRDHDADVPDSFLAVQWTRVKPGTSPLALAEQVKHLLATDGEPLRPSSSVLPDKRPASLDHERLAHSTKSQRVRGRWVGLALAAAIAVAASVIWRPWKKSDAMPAAPASSGAAMAGEKSVAVLAFRNLSEDKAANDYFSDGISEELCDRLGRIPGLRVPASASSFQFKDRQVPPAEMGRQLNVTYLLDGSVTKDGHRIRIRARLISARDGLPVWTSENYDREMRDVFAVQDEITGLIARHLRLNLRFAFTSGVPANPEAYQLYLQGRQAWSLRDKAGAIRLFNSAIELDPKFGRAYAGLADALRSNRLWRRSLRTSQEVRRIVELAETAVRLNPDSAEAHAARGGAFVVQCDFPAAERALRTAIKLNPSYAEAHYSLGRVLPIEGRIEESLATLQRCTALDPLTADHFIEYSRRLWEAGRYSDALAQAEQALSLSSIFLAQEAKLDALVSLGRTDDAVKLAREMETGLDNGENANSKPHSSIIALALSGQRLEAEQAFTRHPKRALFHTLAALGRHEEFLASLDPEETAIRAISNLLFSPYIDPCRKDPRFVRYLDALGFTAAHERAQRWRAAHPPEKRR